MASKDSSTREQESLPFGAIRDSGGSSADGETKPKRTRKKSTRRSTQDSNSDPAKDAKKGPAKSPAKSSSKASAKPSDESPESDARPRGSSGESDDRREERATNGRAEAGPPDGERPRRRRGSRRGGRKRRGKGGRKPGEGESQGDSGQDGRPQGGQGQGGQGQGGRSERRGGGAQDTAPMPRTATGMFVLEKGGFGVLRRSETSYKSSKDDVYVPKRLIQSEKLRDGSIVEGKISRGQKHKFQLNTVETIDGKEPREVRNLLAFKNLTSIDPDFHYAVGDVTGDVSMRIVDLLCPIGRGQRGLIVAPPRSGKTTLMRQFAAGIEKGYPDVHLMVLLVDERPEEATEWRRSIERGEVFVSTADETAKNHIQVAEVVWKRAQRLVELGEDVIILLDSITRLARAYNNQMGGGGRTMSGGLDSRAMEIPRKFFGSARNTETAGSMTILGTTLIETGSRLDQLVFEEFKGTGNMELVLSRKLADRRIFPAIDVERSGTRKEEKLVGMRRLKLIHTLRRVLSRMSFIEAMDLLITKLEDVEKTDDFLARFEVDPDA